MTFSYHRRLAPIIGVVLALALVETLVLHLVVVAYWGWRVAAVVGVLDLSLILALLGLLRSFRRSPIALSDGVLTMRTGYRLTLAVPVATITGFRDQWTAADLAQSGLLNMALATWPTVVFDLGVPIARRRRMIGAVAHCVDDPAMFRSTVLAAIADARGDATPLRR